MATSDNWWSGGNTAWGGYDKKDEKMASAYKDWAMSKDNYHWGKFVDENKQVSDAWSKHQKWDENKPQDGYTDLDKWSFGQDYYGRNSDPKAGNYQAWNMRKVADQHAEWAPSAGFSDDDIVATHSFKHPKIATNEKLAGREHWKSFDMPAVQDKWASHYNTIYGTSDSAAEGLAKFDHINNSEKTMKKKANDDWMSGSVGGQEGPPQQQTEAQKFKDKKTQQVQNAIQQGGGGGYSEPGPNPYQNTSQGERNIQGVKRHSQVMGPQSDQPTSSSPMLQRNPTEAPDTNWEEYTKSQPDLYYDWYDGGHRDNMTMGEYGKKHYDEYGKAEGRMTDWSSDDEGADFEAYTRGNEDLYQAWVDSIDLNNPVTAAAFGEKHWYKHGKAEGRTLNQVQQAQDFKDQKTKEVQETIKNGGGNIQGQWGDAYDGQDLWGLAKSGDSDAMKALHGRIQTNLDSEGELTRDTFNRIAGRELSYEDAKTVGWKGDQASWDRGSMKGPDVQIPPVDPIVINDPPRNSTIVNNDDGSEYGRTTNDDWMSGSVGGQEGPPQPNQGGSKKYPPGYGGSIGSDPWTFRTADFQDSDLDGIDDRDQPGPGQPKGKRTWGGDGGQEGPPPPPIDEDRIKYSTGQEAFEDIPGYPGFGGSEDKRDIRPDYFDPAVRDTIRNKDKRISVDFGWGGSPRKPKTDSSGMPKWKPDPNQASGRAYDVNPINGSSTFRNNPRLHTFRDDVDFGFQDRIFSPPGREWPVKQPQANPIGIGNVGGSSSKNYNQRLHEIKSRLTSEHGFEMPGQPKRSYWRPEDDWRHRVTWDV